MCNNSPISFINTSTGASSYYWDFGDGNNSTATNPTHVYNTPGTYTVTLYATNDNYDNMGNPLCCCTDTAQMIITVDDLPGPNIFGFPPYVKETPPSIGPMLPAAITYGRSPKPMVIPLPSLPVRVPIPFVLYGLWAPMAMLPLNWTTAILLFGVKNRLPQ